jgi:hypothetical protein
MNNEEGALWNFKNLGSLILIFLGGLLEFGNYLLYVSNI